MPSRCVRTLQSGQLTAGDYSVLVALLDDSDTPFADLARRLNCAPGSVDRRVRLLKRAGLVTEARAGGYFVTRDGAVAALRFADELAGALVARLNVRA